MGCSSGDKELSYLQCMTCNSLQPKGSKRSRPWVPAQGHAYCSQATQMLTCAPEHDWGEDPIFVCAILIFGGQIKHHSAYRLQQRTIPWECFPKSLKRPICLLVQTHNPTKQHYWFRELGAQELPWHGLSSNKWGKQQRLPVRFGSVC